jgi:ABC-type branched-subunit amino acid transport system ATPase component/ABC-type branched-subunit amino acid transport system permease subunit
VTPVLALLGWTVSLQAVFNGMVLGLGYAVIAAGLVLIYRSSGIINVAQAAVGAFGVNAFVLLFLNYDIPYPLAMAVGVAASVAIGVITELLVIRRLFDASRVVVLIATVGVAQLITFLIVDALPDSEYGGIPVAFNAEWANIQVTDSLRIGPRETSVLLLIIPVLVGLAYFLNRTKFGLHIRAVADDAENARLVGVSPKKVSTVVWGLAAGFAGYTAIVIAPLTTRTAQELGSVSTVGLLLRALVIGLAARMKSIPLVVVSGLILGAAETLVSINLNLSVGIFDLFMFIAVLVLIFLRARDRGMGDVPLSIAVTRPTIPEHLRQVWWIRHISAMGIGLLFLGLLLVPVLIDKPSSLFTWTNLVLMSAVALSLSLLTGWAGQLSLGQFAFVGVGGLMTLGLNQGHEIGIGLPFVTFFSFSVELPWFLALLAGTAIGIVFSLLIGIPSLRVRGLFLAVATLSFATMASNWMFNQPGWNGGTTSIASVADDRPVVFGIDFESPKMYFLLCLGFLLAAVLVVSRLRRSGSGRTIIAVRDNERMTSAANVSPAKAKLSAFAVSGGLAAMTGGFLVFLLPGFDAGGAGSAFSPQQSLNLVAVAIIGGVGSVGGALLGALWVFGLPALFGFSDAVELLTANLGLLILLLYFPGGLIGVVYNVRDLFLRWYADKRGLVPDWSSVKRVDAVPTRRPDRNLPMGEEPWLRTHDVSVTFGGIRAVSEVSLEVHRGEIVGLIGTNGAGKSTLMNAISGFVPNTGTIEVLGVDVSHLPAHKRHAVGLGRGFQDAVLFPGLTVRETVLVALEARERSLLVPSMFALPPSPGAEKRKGREAEDILAFLGLLPFADNQVVDLSTGTRRIVELACLLATEAKVLLLDEPTGGVAQKETEAFAPLIKRVQRELDAAIVVIAHDMPLIMSISDRVYCLEAGAVISSGSPDHVRNDPAVIASYLGTDERAIVRSNQPAGG